MSLFQISQKAQFKQIKSNLSQTLRKHLEATNKQNGTRNKQFQWANKQYQLNKQIRQVYTESDNSAFSKAYKQLNTWPILKPEAVLESLLGQLWFAPKKSLAYVSNFYCASLWIWAYGCDTGHFFQHTYNFKRKFEGANEFQFSKFFLELENNLR